MTAPLSHLPLFIGSEIYRGSSYGRWHPLRVPRVSTVMDLARAMGWLPKAQFVISPRAKRATLLAWHSAPYLDALERVARTQEVTEDEKTEFQLGTVTNPVFPEMLSRPATGVGGAVLAGELLKDGGCVQLPGGGTHHGFPGRANGFCFLNDPAFALLSLRRHGVQRIAYIDIDAHHPDGVEHGFGGDPDVLMISTHEEGLWPRTGSLASSHRTCLNLPVARGLNDSEMAAILEDLILPALERFAPDAIVLQCGADAVEEDPLSHLALSNRAHLGVLRGLMGAASRLLILGGGGYNPWSVGRLWTGVWATLNNHEIPDRLPAEAEAVLRALTFEGNRRGRNPPEHWFTTLLDQPRPGPVSERLRDDLARLRRLI